MATRKITEAHDYYGIACNRKYVQEGKEIGQEVVDDINTTVRKTTSSILQKSYSTFREEIIRRLSDRKYDEMWGVLGFAKNELELQIEKGDQYLPVRLLDVAESIMVAHKIRAKLQHIANMDSYIQSESLRTKMQKLFNICVEFVGQINSDPFTNPTPAPGHASPEEAEDRF